jgi:hypothetical protein
LAAPFRREDLDPADARLRGIEELLLRKQRKINPAGLKGLRDDVPEKVDRSIHAGRGSADPRRGSERRRRD